MSFFLFIKQFVDMLYPFRILDYMMVILVVILIVYQFALVRPDIRSLFGVTDGIVAIIVCLLTITWVRSDGGYQDYFKVLSAFLLYFVGRVYYDRIKECYSSLVFASYAIVYMNLVHRIWRFGINFIKVKDAQGDFYYNDTDMAFAMILAMIFIVMFGKNTIRKLFTAFVVCPYMVFRSDAGIQMVLLVVIYVILGIYIAELGLCNQRLSAALLTAIMAGLLGIVLFIYAPVVKLDIPKSVVSIFSNRFFNIDNMYSRYTIWEQVLDSCDESLLGWLFGTSMTAKIPIQSLYIKVFYSLGIVGLILVLLMIISILYYVVKVKDRKTFYLCIMMAVLLLGSGVTINSMESTQMSWFPMLFAGMVISSVQAEKEHKEERECLQL